MQADYSGEMLYIAARPTETSSTVVITEYKMKTTNPEQVIGYANTAAAEGNTVSISEFGFGKTPNQNGRFNINSPLYYSTSGTVSTVATRCCRRGSRSAYRGSLYLGTVRTASIIRSIPHLDEELYGA